MSENSANTSQPPTPSPEMKRLNPLIGKWVTEWHIKEKNADTSFRIIGTDTYEWLPGEFFLLHSVDVRMDDSPYQVTEIIGGMTKRLAPTRCDPSIVAVNSSP